MSFVSSTIPPSIQNEPAFWFLFKNDKLLVNHINDDVEIPTLVDLSELNINPIRQQYLGTLNGKHCYSAQFTGDQLLPEGFAFRDLRALFELLSGDFYTLAGHASQIVTWDENHQYCGKCGTPTEYRPIERAKVCPQCQHMNFPRISPCIIVAVIKGNEILLAHSPRFKLKWYSVLAGFVEAGETLEACVKREVKEEVGIDVKNIRYFDNQPWPFPHSLMVGFIADYAGGEIVVDGVEIDHADWFTPETLPNLPTKISIARRLVDWYLENHQK